MYDEELERVMLYYLIFENADYILDENDFMDYRNKRIIKAINELKAEKKEVSMLSIKAKEGSNSVDILKYLSELNTYALGTSEEETYNRIISLSKKRKTLEILKQSLDTIKETEDIDSFSENIIKKINDVQKINQKEKTFVEQVVETTRVISEKIEDKEDYSLYTGIMDLDDILCGLHKQELTIIGARPRSW